MCIIRVCFRIIIHSKWLFTDYSYRDRSSIKYNNKQFTCPIKSINIITTNTTISKFYKNKLNDELRKHICFTIL